MYNESETFSHLIDGQMMQCIVIGEQEMDLPSYLLQGEKACGYLYDEGNLTKWYWKGLTIIDGKRCLYFDELPLFPLTDIASKKRDKALFIVRDVAKALENLPTSFLDLSSGILPIWRIWGVEGGKILILPQDLADLFTSCANEETRYFNSSAWVHHGLHTPFTLCDQMTSLLYFSALGFAPFSDKETREDSFKAMPLSLAKLSLPQSSVSFIDSTLSMGLTKQRDVSGNMESQKALGWFLFQTESLQWTLENLEQPKSRDSYNAVDACAVFMKGQHNRAKQRIFWRTKGWLVLTILAVVVSVSWFTTARIQEARRPPYTAGMEPTQVIQEYYAALNELSLENMDASLAKGVKNPSEMEVTNLYVTRQTRQAYEGINTQIDPNIWLADGKPAILSSTFIYGVANLSIKQLDQKTYLATGVMYTPYTYSDTEESATKEGYMPIYTYDIQQQFTVEMGKRGWYEITSISSVKVQPKEKILVETYTKAANTALSQ